jgi:tetratricopeptide (TPR) repeat protein
MDNEVGSNIEIFCSYAHEDKKLAEKILAHMGKGNDITWYDNMIVPGTVWSEEIEFHLNKAKIILFLVSVDFISSDYCCEIEVPRAMERQARGEVYVIPILLRPVFREKTPYYSLQWLPTDVQPVTNWTKEEEAFVDIVAGIWRVIDALSHSSRGDDLFQQRKFGDALIAYACALNFERGNSFLYEKKGDAAFNSGHYNDAKEAYDQAIKLNPPKAKVAELWGKKAKVFNSMLEPNRLPISQLCDTMLEAYCEAYTLMSEIYKETDEHNSGTVFEDLDSAKDFIMNLMRSKGNSLLEFREWEQALEAYEEAIKWGGHNYELYIEKADVLFKLNRFAEAFSVYQKAVSLARTSDLTPLSVVNLAEKGKKKILEYFDDMERQRKEISDSLE